jgi:outer membrane lipoprotein-sorting protein
LRPGLFIILLSVMHAASATPSGLEIIEAVDNNTVIGTAHYEARLIISIAGELREKGFIGYVRGKNQGYMEFTAPARDKGTRFLRIENELWIYLPEIEKATKIAGHMLRQSLMGSDFSYDDMMENRKLQDLYDIQLIGADTAMGKECFLLELTARVEDVAYSRRRLWVDKDVYIPVKTELYAKSGKLMKEIYIYDYKKIAGRNYPTRVKMINKIRQNTYSEMVIDEISIDITIPNKVFTKAYLERK